jgi:hypothetical protein
MDGKHSAQTDETACGLANDESAPTMTLTEEDYLYTPLKNCEIRVLEILPGSDEDIIQCRLHVVSLDDSEYQMPTVPYSALSYTWGDDMIDRRVFVDGKAISVKPNLEAALLEFRRKAPEPTPLNRREKVVATLHHLQTLAKQLYEKPQRDRVHDGMVKQLELMLMAVFRPGMPESYNTARIKDAPDNFIELTKGVWNDIAIHEGLSTWKNARKYLWIDGLCINQKDYDERAARVRMMPKIYSNASLLVIWLGSAAIELEEITTKTFDEITEGFADAKAKNSSISLSEWMDQTPLEKGVHECIANSLLMMLNSPWFSRTWIRQEYILGGFGKDLSEVQPILVCYGRSRFRDFFPIVMNLFGAWTSPSNHKFIFPGLTNYPTRPQLWNLAQIESSRQFFYAYQNQKPTPDRLLTRTMLLRLVSEGQFQATDPRDLIYSVLGLVEACFYHGEDFIPSALVIDYRAPIEAVYSSFVREIVENTKRLDILSFCGGDGKSIEQSWVPNWSQFSIPFDSKHGRLAEYIRTGTQMYATYLENLPFNATPGPFCDAHFADDLSTLTVSGFLWTEITTETVLLHDEQDEQLRSFRRELILKSTSINAANYRGRNGLCVNDRVDIVCTRFGIPRPGDLVCLILGCAAPIVLRPVENHYKVLGEAYVPGIMYGDAIHVIREERQLMRKFELR